MQSYINIEITNQTIKNDIRESSWCQKTTGKQLAQFLETVKFSLMHLGKTYAVLKTSIVLEL